MSSSKSASKALFARVNQRLVIDLNGRATFTTRIEATNNSSETIALDRDYKFPAGTASGVSSFDENNKEELTAYYKRGFVNVVFKPGTLLPPNQKFSWTTSYSVSQFAKSRENQVYADLLIRPLQSYGSVRIQNHKLDLTVEILRPAPDGKPADVNLTVHPHPLIEFEVTKKSDRVECKFDQFDLDRGSSLRVAFTYEYVPAKSTALTKLISSTGLGIWKLSPHLFKELKDYLVSLIIRNLPRL